MNPEGYNNRGEKFNQIGECELALADFNKVIKLDPKNAFTYCDRGWRYYLKIHWSCKCGSRDWNL